ncbi:MAG TPA: hypothetical protein VFB72_10255, partial [Verrucomicrobiae bacterium]|nr:hypothetical protein [Verrucomicrobiae bacterium]
GLSSSGVFWAGFNNTSGSQTTTPTTIATRVYTRAAGGGYNLGLSKSTSTAADFVWDNTVHSANETIFLVGGYTFNTASTNDDVASLWINPAAATFGNAFAPAPTLTSSVGGDVNSGVIASFVLFNRSASEPAKGIFDELRIGTSWASVTPPAQQPPWLNFAVNGTNLILSWSTNSTGFTLQSSPSLLSSNNWSAVSAPVTVVNGQYMVTNPISGGTQFFRLQGK